MTLTALGLASVASDAGTAFEPVDVPGPSLPAARTRTAAPAIGSFAPAFRLLIPGSSDLRGTAPRAAGERGLGAP